MRTIASLAATAILFCAPFGLAQAQNAPDSGAPAAPATTAAPAAPAAPTTPAAPAAQEPAANAPAPAAQSANPPAAAPPAASAPPPNAPTTTTDNAHTIKKKKATGMTRRQEIEKSIDSGTVPSRYRSSVPKQYQQYIPFSKN